MSKKGRLFRLMTAGYIERIAKDVWLGSKPNHGPRSQKALDRRDIHALLKVIWGDFHQTIDQMPKQANLGNWLSMNFAFLTLSAYRELLRAGWDHESAILLIQNLTWTITSVWTKRAKRYSNLLFFNNQMNQLNALVNLVMKTFFSRPGYEYERGQTENGFYLDVLRCPVAELMKSEGVADLCIEAWCNLDFGLVEILGGDLERTGTRAMGKEKCDFRFSSGKPTI